MKRSLVIAFALFLCSIAPSVAQTTPPLRPPAPYAPRHELCLLKTPGFVICAQQPVIVDDFRDQSDGGNANASVPFGGQPASIAIPCYALNQDGSVGEEFFNASGILDREWLPVEGFSGDGLFLPYGFGCNPSATLSGVGVHVEGRQ